MAGISSQAQIVVPNGNFETQNNGVAAGWQVLEGNAMDVSGDGYESTYGEQLGGGNPGGLAVIGEDINLGSGTGQPVTYDISFYAMNLVALDPPGDLLGVTLDGQPTVSLTLAAGSDTSAYQQYSVFVTTTDSGLRALDFGWNGGQNDVYGFALIDDVTVSVVSVPEPATCFAAAAMLLPFGAGAWRGLRKARSSIK
jgi:hypothetical protein